MRPTHEEDLELARGAALAAGEIVMRHFRRPEEVRFKAPDQPVTAADLAADDALRALLTAARPDYGWLSEETADSPERLAHERLWIVDPIDGTNSFIQGIGDFVICVGLAEAGMPVVGVVLNPVTAELYHASAGGGAFRNGERIRVTERSGAGERPVLLASRAEIARGELEGFEGEWETVPLGSTAYRMVKVADGTGQLTLSRNGKSEWDVCAAAVILQEAGGHSTQIDGAPLRFNLPVPRFHGIVASNGRTHPTFG